MNYGTVVLITYRSYVSIERKSIELKSDIDLIKYKFHDLKHI